MCVFISSHRKFQLGDKTQNLDIVNNLEVTNKSALNKYKFYLKKHPHISNIRNDIINSFQINCIQYITILTVLIPILNLIFFLL